MTITVNFNITKINNDTLMVMDNNSGWGNLPPAKLVLTIRDKVCQSDVFIERSKTIVLYDPDATSVDDIGTSVADQISGELFTQYIGNNGLSISSNTLYSSDEFDTSLYQVSIESTSQDVTPLTKSFYSVAQLENVAMGQLAYIELPYNNSMLALKSIMPWHMIDTIELIAKNNDSNLFYQLLTFFNRNYL